MEKRKFNISLLDKLLPKIDKKLKRKDGTVEVIVPCLNRLSFEKDTGLNDTTKDNPYTTEYGKFKYKIYDDFYFPDAYTDPVEVFCDMVEVWNYCDEDEKDSMVTVLMERINKDVMQQIIEKMCNKRNALAVTLGLEDTEIFDQDEVEDEE